MSDLAEFWDDLERKNRIEHEAMRKVADDYLDHVDRVIGQWAALQVTQSADQLARAVAQNPTVPT
jgi:hypothetical protein